MNDNPWTDEELKTLRGYVSEGHSFSEIASALGRSRNACIGKAAREGIRSSSPDKGGRPSAAKTAPKPKPEPKINRFKPFIEPKKPAPLPIQPRIQAPEDPLPKLNEVLPESRCLSLIERREAHCKWPIGDPRAPGFFYCAADLYGSSAYCRQHHRLAYSAQGAA